MGAYDNPQRITNRSFDALILGGKGIANKLALTSQEITNNIKKQKDEAKAQQALLDQEQQSMFSAVNEVPSTGDPKLDNNIHSFWNTKVDEYYKIKNEMDAGITGRQEGNMKLAKIKALVGQFKTQAAYLATQASGMGTALKNGTLSSTGSVENRNVLSAVGQGGDVRIVERNGQIFYMLPKFDENGKEIEGEGDLLNGAMLNAYAAQDKDLYNEKADFADYETQMYNNLATPNDPSSDYIVTDKFTKGSINPITGQPMNNLEEGYEYTMQYILPNKKDDYLAAAVNSPMMNTMINDDEEMLSEWQDNIPDGYEDGKFTDEPNSIASIAREIGVTDDSLLTDIGITMDQLVNSSWHEYPSDMTSDQRQKLEELQTKIAKTYIARQSFDNNAIQQGTLKSVDRSKINQPKEDKVNPSKNRFTTTQQTVYDNRKDDFIANRDTAEDMYSNGTPDAQTFVTALQNADPTGDYFVNDKGLIQSGNSIVSIPTNAKNASVVLNSKSGIDRTMQNVFSKENPYQAAQVEEEENVNQTSSIPDDATVYKSSATEKKVFDGVLTEEEISLFTTAYPDSDFNSGPLYEEQIKKLSQNPPSGVSRAAYAQSPEVKEKAIRILKRKQAIEDKKDAEASNETLAQYYG